MFTPPVKTKLEVKSNGEHLIAYANNFGTDEYHPPIPLRRAFSLFRSYGFGTLVCSPSEWQPTDQSRNGCNIERCGSEIRYKSCKEYIECLKKHYNTQIVKKECFKIAFFKPEFDDFDSIELNNSDLLGYCLLHRDIIRAEGVEETLRPYVPESIINLPEKRGDVFLLEKYSTKINIAGKIFKIAGNYFSQQNSKTNCCAHAAIKMAIRSYFPEVTAEKINETAGVNHKEIKGNKGFQPEEIVNAILS